MKNWDLNICLWGTMAKKTTLRLHLWDMISGISDVYTDQYGELCYTVETCFKEEIVEQLSNDDLLNELKKRMVIE